jgi:hypothetical protein
MACHSDHQGLKLTKLSRKPFAHALLKVSARETCSSCHAAPKDTVHRDVKAECSQCHGDKAWKPAHFDHKLLAPAVPLHLLWLPRALAGQSARGTPRRRHPRLRELRRVPPGSARGARKGWGPREGATREGLKAMRPSSVWCWSSRAALDDADGRRRHHEDAHRR